MQRKKFGKVILIVCIAVMFLAFVGCSKATGEDFTGTWELVAMEEDGETISGADLDLMQELGLSASIVLEDGGKATLALFDEAMEGSWKEKNASSCTLTFEEETITATLKNGKLTLEDEGAKLIFEKE
ncbi:MAG: lipocalin family protein [Christensenellaceae bacterium]